MKNKTMQEWLSELPDDYELCFSEYTSMVVNENDESEEYFVVLDMPIVGILKNDENKEIRFFTQKSEKGLIQEMEKGENWRLLDNE